MTKKKREEAKELPVGGMWAVETPGLPSAFSRRSPGKSGYFRREVIPISVNKVIFVTLFLPSYMYGAPSFQSCLTLRDPWTVAHQVPLSVEFSRKEYWSGLPFPTPGDLASPGIKCVLQAESLLLSHWESPLHSN